MYPCLTHRNNVFSKGSIHTEGEGVKRNCPQEGLTGENNQINVWLQAEEGQPDTSDEKSIEFMHRKNIQCLWSLPN